MSTQLSLNCLIKGDNPESSIFVIFINDDEPVAVLKERIFERKHRCNPEITRLYQVDYDYEEIIAEFEKLELDDSQFLRPLHILGKTFGSLNKAHVHVIIDSECQ